MYFHLQVTEESSVGYTKPVWYSYNASAWSLFCVIRTAWIMHYYQKQCGHAGEIAANFPRAQQCNQRKV